MTKILQICLLVSLAFLATSVKAQEVTAKNILSKAATATLDTENIATAIGTGIEGKYTAVKMSKGQTEDFRSGFYAGILELQVSNDNGTLRSGKFNLFFKDSRGGSKLYLEEKGRISNVFAATSTPPENYKDSPITGKPQLDFLEPSSTGKNSMNFGEFLSGPSYSLSSYSYTAVFWTNLFKVCWSTQTTPHTHCRWIRWDSKY